MRLVSRTRAPAPRAFPLLALSMLMALTFSASTASQPKPAGSAARTEPCQLAGLPEPARCGEPGQTRGSPDIHRLRGPAGHRRSRAARSRGRVHGWSERGRHQHGAGVREDVRSAAHGPGCVADRRARHWSFIRTHLRHVRRARSRGQPARLPATGGRASLRPRAAGARRPRPIFLRPLRARLRSRARGPRLRKTEPVLRLVRHAGRAGLSTRLPWQRAHRVLRQRRPAGRDHSGAPGRRRPRGTR